MSDPVDGLKARDAKIWDQAYEKYATRLYGSILHLVRRDRQLAEDLHQEAWLAAIDGIDGFDPQRGQFSAWLFSIARNAVATHWRRAARRTGDAASDAVTCERGEFPVEILQQIERAEVVRAALLELGDDERKALLHKYVDSFPVESIAKQINRSVKATESLLTRSRDKLRALLQWYFPLQAGGEKR
ncbi:MAG TPA: sigma-70 family RNA polymerase sigma factor [Planctomycetaceae bacterium]|jgi:RNA polymerase sigma-70 factor (ECF subfamily)|nr:sigma-70 family RNA polymerase sigma factor [Planctomycetaceae bacterium]